MGPPGTYQRTVIQETFVGLEVGDTMIIFVSSKDYFRKKNVQGLLGTRLEPDGCSGRFLQQPQ